MKAQRFFAGLNSRGNMVEAAQGVNGLWFIRRYEYNSRFGRKQWDKWTEFEPSWSTHITNAYTYEVEKREKPLLECGFRVLSELSEIPRVRLPD
jgi:hypothetical protein